MSASGSGTYRVLVSGRQVYESNSTSAADAVASRFGAASVHNPDGTVTEWADGKPVASGEHPLLA